jgi:hypothetical protein
MNWKPSEKSGFAQVLSLVPLSKGFPVHTKEAEIALEQILKIF